MKSIIFLRKLFWKKKVFKIKGPNFNISMTHYIKTTTWFFFRALSNYTIYEAGGI